MKTLKLTDQELKWLTDMVEGSEFQMSGVVRVVKDPTFRKELKTIRSIKTKLAGLGFSTPPA